MKEIQAPEAIERLQTADATFIDIRDPHAYQTAHIPDALLLRSTADADSFIGSADKTRTLIVYCYHGNASISGASFFSQSGFENVYSLAGGFEAWQAHQGDITHSD